jgi:hypothetical protein
VQQRGKEGGGNRTSPAGGGDGTGDVEVKLGTSARRREERWPEGSPARAWWDRQR